MNEMSEKIPEGSFKTEPDQNQIDELFSKEKEQFDKGHYHEAEATLNKILELDEGNVQALIFLGHVYYKNKNYEKAFKYYNLSLNLIPRENPDFIELLRSKGVALSKLNRDDEALECFDTIIGINPEYGSVFISKGISAKNLKYYGLSLQALNKALSFKLNENQKYLALIEKGNVLIELQNFADAIYCFKKALELSEYKLNGLIRMGVSFSRLGNDDEAIKCFDKALQKIKINQGDLESFKKNREEMFDYLNCLNSKGFSLSKLGRENEAIKCFDEVISGIKHSHASKKVSALNSKGRSLINLKRPEEALECYESAIDLNRKDWKAFYNKGLLLMEWEAYLGGNRYQKALESFDSAIVINPSNPELHAQKGNVLVMLDRYEEAENSFNTALRIDQSCASAYTGLGSSKARKEIMIEELKCQKKLLEGISSVIDSTQNVLYDLSKEMESSLKKVSSLIYVQFILGIVLFVLAIALSLLGFDIIGVFSALGGTAFIINSVTFSPSKIQKNRIDYSQWLIAYYNWIHTHHGLSSYLLGEIKKTQKQTDPINPGSTPDEWQKIEKMYKYLNEVSIATIQQMELFCEFPLKDKNNDAYIELLKGVRPQEEDETAGDNAENPGKSPDPSSLAGKK